MAEAGAYSVRIEGMNRQHHISLREEFDEHDKDGTKYIVILDDGYPVATCRFYELDKDTVVIGRVVVLPEYRGQQLGCMLIYWRMGPSARSVLWRSISKTPECCK